MHSGARSMHKKIAAAKGEFDELRSCCHSLETKRFEKRRLAKALRRIAAALVREAMQ